MNIFFGLGGLGGHTVVEMVQQLGGANRYFVIDSDLSDLQCIENKSTFVKCFNICQSFPKIIDEVINYVNNSDEEYKWYPDLDIIKHRIIDSSSQIDRINGRLFFETAVQTGTINNFFDKLNITDEKINIHIVSSLMGGTGSGLILPLLFWLQKAYLLDSSNKCEVYGHFFLPESVCSFVSTRTQMEYLKINACACLLEMEAFTDKYYLRNTNNNLFFEKFEKSNSEQRLLFNNISFLNYADCKNASGIYEYAANKTQENLHQYSNFDSQKAILREMRRPYIELYNDYMRKMDKCKNYFVSPHLDKNWHTILRTYL